MKRYRKKHGLFLPKRSRKQANVLRNRGLFHPSDLYRASRILQENY